MRPQGVTIPPIPAPAFGDFKQVDFSDFKASGGSPQDLDNIVGGPSQTVKKESFNDPFGGQDSSAFGSNPFSAAAFDAAFSSPGPSNGNAFADPFAAAFPATTQVTASSSSMGKDPAEVEAITGMGFSKEQAVNALEM